MRNDVWTSEECKIAKPTKVVVRCWSIGCWAVLASIRRVEEIGRDLQGPTEAAGEIRDFIEKEPPTICGLY